MEGYTGTDDRLQLSGTTLSNGIHYSLDNIIENGRMAMEDNTTCLSIKKEIPMGIGSTVPYKQEMSQTLQS